jgi:hypothetical protein
MTSAGIPAGKPVRIFLSSTFIDLAPVREKVEEAVRKMGSEVLGMETFGARPEQPRATCLAELRRADAVVLILGFRYGSIDSETGISFTHQEVREAFDLGIPVLAFQLTDAAPTSDAERELMDKLRAEVSTRVTPDHVATPGVAAAVVAAIHRRVMATGAYMRPRFFLLPDQYFKPLEDSTALMNLCQPFVGRETTVSRLGEFVTSGEGLLLLSGPGGVGKTRTVREALRRIPEGVGVDCRVVAPGTPWHPEFLGELGSGRTVIVFDDAHQRDDFGEVVRACLTRLAPTSIVAVTRPHAVTWLLREAAFVKSEGVLEVTALESAESVALAKDSLSAGLQHVAEELVRLSARNPLLIVIGGRLLSDAPNPPKLLALRPEEFQRLALDRLLSHIEADTARNTALQRLVTLISAIGPIRIDEPSMRDAVAAHVDVPSDEVLRRASELEVMGLIRRRSGRLRVYPDLLGDHLVHRASVTTDGTSTGYLERVLEVVGAGVLPQALRNAAELEWRLSATGQRTDAADFVWSVFHESLAAADRASRVELLKALRRAAPFSPSKALAEVRWVEAHWEAPENKQLQEMGLTTSDESLRNEVVAVLDVVAHDPRLTTECIQRLAEIASTQAQRYGGLPTAARAIENLVGYREYTRIETQASALEGLRLFVASNGPTLKSSWIVEVLSASLEREGRWTKSSSLTVQFGVFPLFQDYPELARNRERSVRLLGELARSGSDEVASAAVRALAMLLNVPHGGMGRSVEHTEIDVWKRELTLVAEVLESLVGRALSPTVDTELRRILAHDPEWMLPGAAELIDRLRRLLPDDERAELVKILTGSVWEFGPFGRDPKETAAEFMTAVARSARWVLASSPDPRLIVELLRMCCLSVPVDREGMRTLGGLGELLAAITRESPAMAADVARLIVSERVDGLTLGLQGVLAADPQPNRALERELFELAETQGTDLARFRLASGLRWLFDRRRATLDDLELVKIAVRSSDPWTRACALDGLRHFKTNHVRDALDVMVNCSLGGSSRCVDHALAIFGDDASEIPFAELNDSDIEKLLKEVESTESLTEGQYHTFQFLRSIASRRAVPIVRMLLARVNRGEAEDQGWGRDRQPLPYSGDRARLVPDIARAPDYADALELVIAAASSESYRTRWWASHLMVMVVDVATLTTVLRSVLTSGRADKGKLCVRLVRSMDRSFVTTSHEVVADILEAAAMEGEDALSYVRSELVSIANSGVFSSTPGQPAAVHVELEARSRQLASDYSARPTVARFYSDLREYMQRVMERERADDLEIEDGE